MRRTVVLSLGLAALAFGLNTWLCSQTAAIGLPFVFSNSDMNTNLKWAETIRQQGLLNPEPYHPYPTWMHPVGTFDEWLTWWGGPKIFQQSPLYAYGVAASIALFDDLMPLYWFQALLAVAMAAALGRIAWRLTDQPYAAVAAILLTAAYAPFQVYSWALLRDFLGWVLTAAVLVSTVELQRASSRRGRLYASLGLGVSLGLGFLGRESFLIIAPVMIALAAVLQVRKREPLSLAAVVAPFALCVLLLVIRNVEVGAPLLSSSNRLPEAIVIGHAVSTQPAVFTVPPEMRVLFEKAGGSNVRLFIETLKTHPGPGSWLWLQLRKALSLFDPTESCDNVSIGFFAELSVLVRFGVRHWMVIVPGLIGAAIGIARRDRRHLVLWVMLPLLASNVLINIPVSRYRQAMVVLWIPWAVSAGTLVVQQIRSRQWRSAAIPCGAALLLWALCLGPLAQLPPRLADRPAEYQMAIAIYEQAHDDERAAQMRQLLHEKFPGSERVEPRRSRVRRP